jgi:hypothetical protein
MRGASGRPGPPPTDLKPSAEWRRRHEPKTHECIPFSLAVYSGVQFLCSDIVILPWACWEHTFSSTYTINPFDWNASNIVISDFGYCSIPENEGLLKSDVQVIPFFRDTCKWWYMYIYPRRPLYGWYARVLCSNGIQCCYINYRQRIQSEQMTGLTAFHSKTDTITYIYK